jgi:hypothetical protein
LAFVADAVVDEAITVIVQAVAELGLDRAGLIGADEP